MRLLSGPGHVVCRCGERLWRALVERSAYSAYSAAHERVRAHVVWDCLSACRERGVACSGHCIMFATCELTPDRFAYTWCVRL